MLKLLGDFISGVIYAAIFFGMGWFIHSAYAHQNPLSCLGF